MNDDALLAVLHDTADAVRRALDSLTDWGLAADRAHEGQHVSDQVGDDAARGALLRAGLGVLSEESGMHEGDRDIVVVVDPVDGSTNAALGIPWYATSLCAVDPDGPRAAVVVNQASGVRFEAVRGGGARCDGEPVHPGTCTSLADAVVGLAGYPPRHLGWRQFRALGAAALDICAVAAGVLDAYVDCSAHAHGPWDYLGGLLVCREAGAVVEDALGRDLVVVSHGERRRPLAAATRTLFDELHTAAKLG